MRARRGSTIDTYSNSIREEVILDGRQESELATLVYSGDLEARDRMIQSNLRLVIRIARSYQGRGLDLGDLIEEGNLGLLRAVESFDPTDGNRFSTYAGYWIKQSIQLGIISQARQIRVNSEKLKKVSLWRKRARLLEETTGVKPTDREIGDSLGFSEDTTKTTAQAIRILDAGYNAIDVFGGESVAEGGQRGVVLADESTEDPAEAAERRDEIATILGRMSKLTEKESLVIRMMFGIGPYREPVKQREIQAILGVGYITMMHLRNSALDKLRTP